MALASARQMDIEADSQQVAQRRMAAGRAGEDATTELVAAEELTGIVVYNGAGDLLGDIDAIMLDVASGAVAHVVLRVGGFMGLGAKKAAVPWRLLQYDPVTRTFRLDMTAERLAEAARR